MSEENTRRIRFASITISLSILITGIIIIGTHYAPGEDIMITAEENKQWDTSIYIGGTVSLPGLYPCYYGDTIESLVEAAGGISNNTALHSIVLTVGNADLKNNTQKIDINRADSWLLEALPGIGETLAHRIMDFRNENGMFNTTFELMQVEGIGSALFEKLSPYISVSEE